MKFTDNDLKRLKNRRQEIMEYPDDTDLKSVYVTSLLMDIPAILVRLEESEKLNDAFINGFPDAIEFRLKTWRKAVGK